MRTLADFRRTAVIGSRWHCENHLHPHVSGERVITAGKAVLHYSYTKADGSTGTNGRLEFPKADACRISGDTVEFLWAADDDRVSHVWTLIRKATP